MKLVKNKPVPPRYWGRVAPWMEKARAMALGDCYEGCTRNEASKLIMAIVRDGFSAASRKMNGTGVSVWKLRSKDKRVKGKS